MRRSGSRRPATSSVRILTACVTARSRDAEWLPLRSVCDGVVERHRIHSTAYKRPASQVARLVTIAAVSVPLPCWNSSPDNACPARHQQPLGRGSRGQATRITFQRDCAYTHSVPRSSRSQVWCAGRPRSTRPMYGPAFQHTEFADVVGIIAIRPFGTVGQDQYKHASIATFEAMAAISSGFQERLPRKARPLDESSSTTRIFGGCSDRPASARS